MGPQLSFLRPYGQLAHGCYSLPIGSGPTAIRRSSKHCTALRTVFQLVAQKISWYGGAEGESLTYIYPAVERFEPEKSPVAARPRIVPSGGSLRQRSVA